MTDDKTPGDEYVREGSLEMAALRQLVFGLAPEESHEYDTIIEGVHDAIHRINNLEAENDQLRDEIADLREQLDRLGDIGEEKTSKEQKIAAVVTYADNVRQRENKDAVTVLPKTITGVADVSRRYAYDLVDDMAAEYDWAHDPREISTHVEQDSRRKGVLIDFEGVHGEAVAVNKFTIRSTGQGVAD